MDQQPKMQFEVLQTDVAYQGFFQLQRLQLRHQLFAGGWGPVMTRELVQRKAAVVVMVVDPVQRSLLMLEQFRVGAMATGQPWLRELVAGLVEADETPEDVARRETMEEAGLALTGPLLRIHQYLPSPGGSDEQIHLFATKADLREVGGIHGLASEHEDIRALVVPLSDAWAWLDDGKINNAASIIGLQWLRLHPEWLTT